MTERLEKLAIIAIILWLVSFILDPLIFLISSRMGGIESAMVFSAIDVLPVSIKNIVGALVNIGVGVWLYRQAKCDGKAPVIWALFGFVFSIIAVIIYLLSQLLDELKLKKTDNKATAPDATVPPIL